ncbi:MAG: Maf family nucleotide pyrophosphatase [Chloroflexi bacterium]|nr:Maf family nucleotide pyrophosphatase [Chloroflexota bacterium]
MPDSPSDGETTLTLELRGLGRHGEALAETEYGKPVFVFGGIPGETVTAEVVATRRGYVAARVVDVADPSPNRVAPACRYFGECTGCQWQHVAYERQLEMKREALADAFQRVGGLDVEPLPTLASPDPLGYRNHARFTVSRQGGRLGYVHKERRRHVEVAECLLMAPWINHALASLQGHVAETTQLSLRYGVHTGDYLLQPTFQNMDVPLASGQKHYHEAMLGHRFRVSSPSFFQVNTRQAEQMAELVMDQLRLDGSQTVVDAYAGVATFAVLMADRARRVVAVEESAAAVADARVNVEGIPNVELRQARTEDVLLDLAAGGIDAVLLDPPRTGCMPGTLDALLDVPPERVVYVSCDPETLARDLAVLTAGPFRIEQVRPVDMFPQTYHVEAVATLVRDDARLARLRERQALVLASSSPRRAEILGRLGLDFETAAPGVDEPEPPSGADPVEVAQGLALAKASAAASHRSAGSVLAADTVVELDGVLLGKPHDEEDAARMLRELRRREHRVITAVALVDAATGETAEGYRASRVLMRDYTDDEIAAYVASGAPMDKAGAYGVQDEAFAPAAEGRGCYLNVVGLPVCETLKLAERFGLRLRPKPGAGWPGLERCPACAQQVWPKPLSGRSKR